MKKKIYYTEFEVTKIIDNLNDDIIDLKNTIKSGKHKSYEIKIFRKMIEARKEKIRDLEAQPYFMESKLKVKTEANRKIPFSKLDLKDLTFSENKGELLYLTGRYKNGLFLGFYTRSPWGTTKDREQGWGLIDPYELKVVDMCESKTDGRYTGDTRDWKAKTREENGKLTKLTDHSGDLVWKITDN